MWLKIYLQRFFSAIRQRKRAFFRPLKWSNHFGSNGKVVDIKKFVFQSDVFFKIQCILHNAQHHLDYFLKFRSIDFWNTTYSKPITSYPVIKTVGNCAKKFKLVYAIYTEHMLFETIVSTLRWIFFIEAYIFWYFLFFFESIYSFKIIYTYVSTKYDCKISMFLHCNI